MDSRLEIILKKIMAETPITESPQSRLEEIFIKMAQEEQYINLPQSRWEDILLAIQDDRDYTQGIHSEIENILWYIKNGAEYTGKITSRISQLIWNAREYISNWGSIGSDVTFVLYDRYTGSETIIATQRVASGGNAVSPYATNAVINMTWGTARFDGWSATKGGEIDASILQGITEEKTVYSVLTNVTPHTVTYYDDQGTLLSSEQVINGNNCASAPSPTKDSTVIYSYSLSGWARTLEGEVDATALSNVTEDRSLYAVFTATQRSYTVAYYDYDETAISTETVLAGGNCASAPTPTRASTSVYSYAFDGWAEETGGAVVSGATQNILADKVLFAHYAATRRSYTVSYYDDQGTLFSSESVLAEGDCVEVPTPTKDPTIDYVYSFSGWSATQGGAVDAGLLSNILADKSVYAVFTQLGRTYTITYKNRTGEETVATEIVAAHGNASNAPTIAIEEITNNRTKTRYTFSGWGNTVGGEVVSGLLENVTQDITAYVICTSILLYHIYYYTKINQPLTASDAENVSNWMYSASSTPIATEWVVHGEDCQNVPTGLTRAIEYEVVGTSENYNDVIRDANQNVLQGALASYDYQHFPKRNYSFYGWALNSNSTSVASLSNVTTAKNFFTLFSVTFLPWTVSYSVEGIIASTEDVYNGQDCTSAPTPTKASDSTYDYTFSGWALTDGGAVDATATQNITSDITLYAVFTSSLRSFTVSYYDDDDTLLSTESVVYGNNANGPLSNPTKASTAYYTYPFLGWELIKGNGVNSGALQNITADRSVWAVYDELLRTYTVSYYDRSGTLLDEETVSAGGNAAEIPAIATEDIKDTSTGTGTRYTFIGWGTSQGGSVVSGLLIGITSNIDAYAICTSTALYRVRYYSLVPALISGASDPTVEANWSYTAGDLIETEWVVSGGDCDSMPVGLTKSLTTSEGTHYANIKNSSGSVTYQSTALPNEYNYRVDRTFTFAGWTTASSRIVTSRILENISAAKDVYTVFTETLLPWTVSYSVDGTVVSTEQVYDGEDCISVPTPTKESDVIYDYTFSGWATTSGGSVVSGATTNIISTQTLYAVFTTSAAVKYGRAWIEGTLTEITDEVLGFELGTTVFNNTRLISTMSNPNLTLLKLNSATVTPNIYNLFDDTLTNLTVVMKNIPAMGDTQYHTRGRAKKWIIPKATFDFTYPNTSLCYNVELLDVYEFTTAISMSFSALKTLILRKTSVVYYSTMNLSFPILEHLYVPDDLVSDYQNHTYWSTYSSVIDPLSDYVEVI